MEMKMIHGNCLDVLKELEPGSFDLAFGCLPRGGQAPLPAPTLLKRLRRVMAPGSAIVLLPPNERTAARLVIASEDTPFSILHPEVWIKPQGTNPLQVRQYPMKQHETFLVLRDMLPPRSTFNRQQWKSDPYKAFASKRGATIGDQYHNRPSRHRDNPEGHRFETTAHLWPQDKRHRGPDKHKDGQPVEAAEHFILTYTNPGDRVLDFCAGGGTTGEAAKKLGRHFTGIELDPTYFEMAKRRVGIA